MSKEYREKLAHWEKLANQNGGHNKVIAELRKIVELKVLKERALNVGLHLLRHKALKPNIPFFFHFSWQLPVQTAFIGIF